VCVCVRLHVSQTKKAPSSLIIKLENEITTKVLCDLFELKFFAPILCFLVVVLPPHTQTYIHTYIHIMGGEIILRKLVEEQF